MSRFSLARPGALVRQPLVRLFAPLGIGLVLHSAPAQATGFFEPGIFNADNWTSSPAISVCPTEDPASCYNFSSNSSLFIASAPITTTTFTSVAVPSPNEPIRASFTYSFEPANAFQSASYTVGSQTFPLPESNGTPLNIWLTSGQQLSFSIYSAESADPAFLTITNFDSVPAPLPILGGAAAFGWIRRRRAYLRNFSNLKEACKR